jgi:micrococcal nuclease
MFRVAVAGLMLLAGCYPRSELDDGNPDDAGPGVDIGFIPDMVLVSLVLDGDTIIVSAGSHLKTPDGAPLDGEKIRLIGVDTPEIEHPPEPAECWGPEAMTFTETEIGGRTVELTYDTANGTRDEFGRLLAYVARDGTVHNERLISTGNGRAFRQFPHRDRSKYIDLEEQARDQNLGLWACP